MPERVRLFGWLAEVNAIIRSHRPDITGAQAFVFHQIASAPGPLPIADLISQTGMAKSRISRCLTTLCSNGEGLVCYVPGPDRRSKAVQLTPKGEALVEELLKAYRNEFSVRS
jgi:DNA-binding MarR family transcriptional regulator